MFLGEYSHNLDDKGRITLPAPWRKLLGESVIITRGMERCLLVFRASDLDKLLDNVSQVGITGADIRQLARFITSKAAEEKPDKQGRITIPQSLRDFAGLAGEMLVVGAYDHAEIWNPAVYQRADADLVKNVPDISERVNQAFQRMHTHI